MANILTKGSLFPATLTANMFNKVKGHSSVAALSASEPISFNGKTEFTFSLDNEVDIVAENGKKGNGEATVEPVTIIPIKFEYGTRVSDEFVYGSEEVQLNYLAAFAEGFSKKVARGLDIASMHGYNQRTKSESTVVGNNHFDAKVTQKVKYTAAEADTNVDTAIAAVEERYYQEGKPGDLCCMDFGKGRASHIGIVKENLGNGKYKIIEGNTSLTSNDNGGKVMIRTRKMNVIRGFGPLLM